jgi:hypothetical protein
MTDDEDHPNLQTSTECEIKEKVLKWKTGCSRKGNLHNKEDEDHNDDMGSPMNVYEDDKI